MTRRSDAKTVEVCPDRVAKIASTAREVALGGDEDGHAGRDQLVSARVVALHLDDADVVRPAVVVDDQSRVWIGEVDPRDEPASVTDVDLRRRGRKPGVADEAEELG